MTTTDHKKTLAPLILDESRSSPSRLDFQLDSPHIGPLRFVSRRRRLVIATGSALSILSLLIIAYLSFSRSPLLISQDPLVSQDPIPQSSGTPPWDRKSALLGPPTDSFRGSYTSHYHLSSRHTIHFH